MEDDGENIARYKITVVITQLYSAMLKRGLRRGYIYTGPAIVFLRIPVGNYRTVEYHVSEPPKRILTLVILGSSRSR